LAAEIKLINSSSPQELGTTALSIDQGFREILKIAISVQVGSIWTSMIELTTKSGKEALSSIMTQLKEDSPSMAAKM
jgi:hypothetical protein